MLKKKLQRNATTCEIVGKRVRREEDEKMAVSTISISELFATPFWKCFYDIECDLNGKVEALTPPANITHTYNPLVYAADLHCAYLHRYLSGPKALMFVGMNPGPNGMGQTGIPFGNIGTVRDSMGLKGYVVQQPPLVHPKRPVKGMACTIEEPSGVRIWSLLQRLAGGSLDTFAQKCFVHNFCPLAFFDKKGSNITPNELKGEYKAQIRDACVEALDKEIDLVKPEVLVAVGEYVYNSLKKSRHSGTVKILKISHPSPRSLNNQNWPQNAEQWLIRNDLLKYIQNKC